MARKIIWTETASSDLESVFDFISKDSTIYAATFIQSVVDSAESLSEMSKRFRYVPELSKEEIREVIIGNYRLIYLVSEESIHILALIHGSRDLKAWWEKEARDIPE